MTGSTNNLTHRPAPTDHAAEEFFDHSSAKRVNTDAVIAQTLRQQYPELKLTIAPADACNLLAYASTGHASFTPVEDAADAPAAGIIASLKWRMYIPPARRLDKQQGVMADHVIFGKYIYKYKSEEFILYVVEGRDGTNFYPAQTNNYILSNEEHVVDELIKVASRWSMELHNEVWVFDRGYWQKNAELYQSVQKASWDSVILDPEMKKAIREDIAYFFDNRDTYEGLKVPWKRGVIYYGPPGNGKTISIKAIMKDLYGRDEPIPTCYVRTLASFGGPEYALSLIFNKARAEAPCLLVFEDLDSIVSDGVRSYFLNEVDGLKANDGILMVGSTNHLDRLDPGISKRPSRFDRKYLFPDPNQDERIQYCHFWQHKLADNKDLDFPDSLCPAIADITDGFSFAYMQEAFVASLLTIASNDQQPPVGDEECLLCLGKGQQTACNRCNPKFGYRREHDDLNKYLLWRVIKKQVKILRDEISDSDPEYAKRVGWA